MRAGLWSLLASLCAAFALAAPACAQTGPVIVIPGKPGLPVIMNGLIVDGAVVYGDWGLARPNNAGLIIVGPVGYAPPETSPGYFPATGHLPRVGRQEVEPPARSRPRVNTNYYRNWSIESEFQKPVTEYPPFDPPQVIEAPRENRNVRRDFRPHMRRDVR
jgi:hypothetical protein